MSFPSPHVDPDALTRKLAAEFSVSEEIVQAIADPKVIEGVARSIPAPAAKIQVTSILIAIVSLLIIVAMFAPVFAFLLRLSFSVAAHLWGWATF